MEAKRTSVSTATLNRWWLFILLFVTGIAIYFSSVYLFYFPVGFQGGRNPSYRTIARTDTEERGYQSEKNLSLNQGNSGEGNQGQENSRINGSNGGQGGGNGLESNRVTSDDKFKDIVSFTGIVSQVNEDQLMILCEKGNEIVIENKAWWFATDTGFSAEIGDSIYVNGFYETADEFEVSTVENLTKGVEVQIREGSGRPLWAGNRRGA